MLRSCKDLILERGKLVMFDPVEAHIAFCSIGNGIRSRIYWKLLNSVYAGVSGQIIRTAKKHLRQLRKRRP